MLEPVDEPMTDALRAVAARYPDARLVVLFGSVARAAAGPLSDADVGVAGVSFWRGLELGAELEAHLRCEVHVVDLDHASLALRFAAAREGVVLAEGEPGAWARFQAQAALEYFDLAPIVARCAEGARRVFQARGARGHG
jgi:predicted nucleotidyltransferase